MTSSVCEISNGGVTTFRWMCDECITFRKTVSGGNWTVKVKDIVAWGCDDCATRRQLAPGYATPAVAFAPTTPDAFVPAPGWKADPLPETWAARLERLKREQWTQQEAAA